MSDRIELVCIVCTEEFVISSAQWTDPSRVLLCPCCGSTDVLPRSVAEALAQEENRPAAA